MPTSRKKKTAPAIESSADVAIEAPVNEQPREDKKAGLSLPQPKGTESRHYLDAIDEFQASLAQTDIRVVKATIPCEYAPAKHVGPHAGFPVVSGEVFEVKTNTGDIIN